MFEAFDIYTMASQAGKNGRYNAAVAFHEILVKQFEKNMTIREIRYNHFEDNRITYLRAKYLLNVAKAAHDDALLHKGQYGKHHTCNSHTFRAKFREKHVAELQQNVTTIIEPNLIPILDRDTLFSYKPADRKERSLSGRRRWTEPYDATQVPKPYNVYIAAQNSQIDKLCTGKQIRVNSYPKLSNLMFIFNLINVSFLH